MATSQPSVAISGVQERLHSGNCLAMGSYMKNSYAKAKGRASGGQFLALPHNLITHERFQSLSSPAVHLLVTLGAQYNGINNGDLCSSASVMKKYGWNSVSKTRKAMDELLNKGFLIKSRQGGVMGPCHLWALAFRNIDECRGKGLDVKQTVTPYNYWKDPGFKQKHDFPKIIDVTTAPQHHPN